MSNHSEDSVIILSEGKKMYANFCLPTKNAPCVVMSHGLESSKDGDKWLVLSPMLCDAGIASLRFSYRGCGEGADKSEGNFEDTTLTGRIADFKAAINFALKRGIDKGRLGVIGSSFGGMVAIAAKDERIKAMVLLATPYSIPIPKKLRLGSYIDLGSGNRLKASFFNDLKKHNLGDDIKNIHCPLLIIQGSQDEVVPVEDAYNLCANANEPKRLEIIDGGNHMFDAPEHLERVISLSMGWFKRYL